MLTMDGADKDYMTANNIYVYDVYDGGTNRFVSQHSDIDSIGSAVYRDRLLPGVR